MKHIRRLPRAVRDLDEIWTTIFQDNPPAADKLVERIIAATARLSDHTHSGSPKAEVMADLRSIPVGRYTVYYRVSARTVDVLRIVHSHRDIQQISFDEDALTDCVPLPMILP